jgi:mannan endo-1,4-beta-mannosidase
MFWRGLALLLFLFMSTGYSKPFITKHQDELMEGSKKFRFFALATSNLHQNEEQLHADYSNRFPDEYEIRDTLLSLHQMGGTATRCFPLSYKAEGNDVPVYVEGLGVYNEQAFRTLDKVFQVANELNVRIIFPLIDSHSFWGWRGVKEFAGFSGKSGDEFWTSPEVKQNFKRLIFDVLNRTNYYTGVKYKDDPIVLAWHLGNEFESYIYDNHKADHEDYWKTTIAEWSLEMAEYIKSIDPNHLVMEAGGDRDLLLQSPHIDIMSDHYYAYWNERAGRSTDLARINRDSKEYTRGYQKALIIDEFGMSEKDTLISLMDEMIRNGTSGGFLWGIRGHRRDGGFYYHNENGSKYNSYRWPGFSNAHHIDEQFLLNTLRTNAYKMRQIPVPPIQRPSFAPVMLPISSPLDIKWKGVTGARYYDIERSDNPVDGWQLVGKNIEDGAYNRDLFKDTVVYGNTYYYRVQAINEAGRSPFSKPISITW